MVFCEEQNHGLLFGHYRGRVRFTIENRDFRGRVASAFHMDGLFPAFLVDSEGT